MKKGLHKAYDESAAYLRNPARPEMAASYVYVRPLLPGTRIDNLDRMVVFFEAHDKWGDGINVGFVDGHVWFTNDQQLFLKLLDDTLAVYEKAGSLPPRWQQFRKTMPRSAAEPADNREGGFLPSTPTTEPAAGEAKQTALAIEPWQKETGTVNIKVVDEARKPVAGVKIQPNGLRTKIDPVTWWGWSLNQAIPVPTTPAVTNADGIASIVYPKYIGVKLEAGAITFNATHPEYCPAASQGYAVDGNDKLVLKKGATLKVVGYVSSKANTVPVKVQVTDAEVQMDDSAWQDAGNNVQVTHQLPAGKHYVRLIQLPQDAPPRFSEAVKLETEAGREYTLQLEIRPGVRVEGNLDTSVPRPVRDGWIIGDASPAERDMDKNIQAYSEWIRIVPNWYVQVPIAEDGTFVLPSVPAGGLQLVGMCEGYLSKSPALWHSPGMFNPQAFPASGQAAQVELKMEPSATCEIHVVNEQGQPVEGAKVAFWPNYGINGRATILAPSCASSEDILRGKAKDSIAIFYRPTPYQATTNTEGIATVKGLPGMKETFRVTSDKYELPAMPTYGDLRRREVVADLASGKTTAVTVTVQSKGKDSLTDPRRPGEKRPIRQAASQPTAGDMVYCGIDPGVRTDYVGKIDPEGDRTEFHGKVVDEAGEPLEGVLVDVWTWYPGNETHTDKDGYFQLTKLDRDSRIEVRFSKDGYAPRYIVQQPTGVKDAVVVLGTKTYFEGTVTDSKGQPMAGALIRITPPPQHGDGTTITTVWTEARSDDQGHYRLYAQQGKYEFQVKGFGGVARLGGILLKKDEARQLDIQLQPGLTFRAKVTDTQTHQPIAGLKLYSYEHEDVSGVSDGDGLVEIAGMMPGTFEFQVEAKGYARWWSAQCLQPYQRYENEVRPGSSWQRNFDYLSFDLQPDMQTVTIDAEPAVHIRGKVVDPEGSPVAGATVAPALTGTGNSLTGDTRFCVRTKEDGTFEMFPPAGNGRDYNLVAHDGKYGQWRHWANGVLPPIRTKPGQQIDDVVLTLTSPATVKGRVLDADGKPVVDRQVRASAFDNLENRYYDPETRTNKDGSFELKFVRPGKHYIQAYPFWIEAESAPKGTSQVVTLEGGQILEGIELTAQPTRR